VMRRQALLLAGATACGAASVLLALLSRDVGRWQQTLRVDDVAAAAGWRDTAWSVNESLPFSPARAVLAVDDDVASRRAVALFRQAYTRKPDVDRTARAGTLRVRAEAALAHEIRTDRNRRRASETANLLGILAFVDAAASPAKDASADRSILEFRNALQLDPRNDRAKANLELTYRQTSQSYSVRGREQLQRAANAQASSAAPGHGY
jgi:hypothetical protein